MFSKARHLLNTLKLHKLNSEYMYTYRPTEGKKKNTWIMPALSGKGHRMLHLYKDCKTKTETDLVSVSPKPWFRFVFLLRKKRILKFNMKHSCAQILKIYLLVKFQKDDFSRRFVNIWETTQALLIIDRVILFAIFHVNLTTASKNPRQMTLRSPMGCIRFITNLFTLPSKSLQSCLQAEVLMNTV